MKRVKYVIANWKMNGNSASVSLLKSINKHLAKKKRNKPKVVICPPFTLIGIFSALKSVNLTFGAQNIHRFENGAYTGEISSSMIKDVKAKFVIIGHSERRMYQKEGTDELNEKILNALNNKLKVIFCIGEKRNEIKKRNTILQSQLKSLPKNFSFNEIIIAYEPVWAIGTGLTPTVNEIEKIHLNIRSLLKKYVGKNSEKVSILYGGSVNSKNAHDILSLKNVDGALVGGASLDANEFCKIIDS
tara:strand:+ start:386 stop:1120 length:735 start_codon:yes stop_codon:yes gene_type:complete